MRRQTFVAGAAATGLALASGVAGVAQEAGSEAPAGGTRMTQADVTTGYAPVNGLEMYYELHGRDVEGQPPLLLLHGGFMSIAGTFGQMLPALTEQRRIVAVEQQGHGHTADIVSPEHALELVRGIPRAHLAVLPMRDHVMLVMQPDLLLALLAEFLAAPLPEAG